MGAVPPNPTKVVPCRAVFLLCQGARRDKGLRRSRRRLDLFSSPPVRSSSAAKPPLRYASPLRSPSLGALLNKRKAPCQSICSVFVVRRGSVPVRSSPASSLGVFLVLFFRFSSSVFRSAWSLFLAWLFVGGWLGVAFAAFGCWLGVVAVAALPVLFGLWWSVFAGLRRLLFVRFPRPAAVVSPRGSRFFPLPSSSPFFPVCRWWSPRWVCVPASAVPGWLRLVGSGAVLPAVVRRRSGVLLFAWVCVPCVRRRGGWVPLFSPPVGGETTEQTI